MNEPVPFKFMIVENDAQSSTTTNTNRTSVKSTSIQSQSKRREDALRLQKERRHKSLDHARFEVQSTEISTTSNLEENNNNQISDSMNIISENNFQNNNQKQFQQQINNEIIFDNDKKQRNNNNNVSMTKEQQKQREERKKIEKFKNRLMMPEDLIELPIDLKWNWLATPLPQNGIRCYIYTSNGTTWARKSDGTALFEERFETALPNGSKKTRKGQLECQLDCVFLESVKTFYVLDIMLWAGYAYYDCEASFRSMWGPQKLAETRCGEISDSNPFKFVYLPRFETDVNSLSKAISMDGNCGLLFTHKETHYVLGTTPLAFFVPSQSYAQFSQLFQQLPNQEQQMQS